MKLIIIAFTFVFLPVSAGMAAQDSIYSLILKGCPEGLYREYAEIKLNMDAKKMIINYPEARLSDRELDKIMQFLIDSSDKDLRLLIHSCLSSHSFYALDLLMQLHPPNDKQRKDKIIIDLYKKYVDGGKISSHNFEVNYFFCERWQRHHDYFKETFVFLKKKRKQ